MCEYFHYLFINPYKPGQMDPTSLDAVEVSNEVVKNECNMLDPEFWTQGSGTKIYPESLAMLAF